MSGSVARRLGLLLASVGVGLVALELAVELWLPVGGVVYRLDDRLLHDARPNASRIQPMPAGAVGPGDASRVYVSTGEQGYRGASLDHRQSKPRVLVIGDSLVMAENVPDDATFVRQLGRALEATLGVDEIEMVNAGRSGYGPDQALLLLERDGPMVAPDLVVFVLCAHNDFGDLMRNKLFRLGSGGELVPNEPYVGDRIRAWFQAGEVESQRLALWRLWDFYRGPVPAPEAAPSAAIELYLAALREQYEEHFIRRDREVVSLFEDVYDADVAIGVGPGVDAKVAMLEAIAIRAAQFSEMRLAGAPVRFVVVPSAVDICEGFGIRVDPAHFPAYRSSRLAETMVSAVSSAGQGLVLDLTHALTPTGDTPPLFVGGTDIHWNAAGQRVGAGAVAAWLASDPMVRSRLAP